MRIKKYKTELFIMICAIIRKRIEGVKEKWRKTI